MARARKCGDVHAERMIRFWRGQAEKLQATIEAKVAEILALTEVKITLQLRCEDYEIRLRELHSSYQEQLAQDARKRNAG